MRLTALALAAVVGISCTLGGEDAGSSESEPQPEPIVEAPDPEGSAEIPAAPEPVVDPGPDPYEEMVQRYRPGPYVEVDGMLPSGSVEAGTQSWMNRTGRTIDNPWLVNQGRLMPQRSPSATPTEPGVPTIRHAAGENATTPLTVVPRVPTQVAVQIDDADGLGDVRALVVAFEDYNGHFIVPVLLDNEVHLPDDQEPGVTPIHFAIDAAIPPLGRPPNPNQPFDVTMYVAAVDRGGSVSNYVTRPLRVMPVGTGDVEVTMTMSQATDLDLYVIDPAGVTIYYGNTRSMTGGALDLDANAACMSNVGVNNEHIFWADGLAPAGTYTVRVANYQSCIGGGAVDYSVTVHNCGETVVLSGQFQGQGQTQTCTRDPGGNRNWCQEVVQFEVTPCEDPPSN